MDIKQLLALSDIDFLRELVQKYPESRWMIEAGGHTSAEAVQSEKKVSLAERVFGYPIANSIEFDRAATGVLCLKYVLTNDYQSFTACQNDAVRLTPETFAALKDITDSFFLESETDLTEIAFYAVLCNDLGKTEQAVTAYKTLDELATDHDTILAELLKKRPELFIGLNSFPADKRQLFLDGIQNGFNFGQFIQGENLPADLIKFQKISKVAQNLYIIHVLFDIAGAAGHIYSNGSLVFDEQETRTMILALNSLLNETEPLKIYRSFIKAKGLEAGIATQTREGFAQARLYTMCCGRFSDKIHIQKAWQECEPNVRAILTEELNYLTTYSDPAIMIYYAPALISNMKRSLLQQYQKNLNTVSIEKIWRAKSSSTDNTTVTQEAYRRAFVLLSEIYQATRIAIRYEKNAPAIVTIDAHAVARELLQDMDNFLTKKIKTVMDTSYFGKASFKLIAEIPVSTQVKKITECLPDGRTAFIGIGGGSDCVQAMQLGQLMPQNNACVISIRAAKTQSQSAKNSAVGQDRTPLNHGGMLMEGVYRITPETTAAGRFMESMIAGRGVPVYLVLDNGLHLTEQLDAVLKEVGAVQNIVAVDTGGDCLYMNNVADLNTAETTPDQDYNSLKAIHELDKTYRKITAVMAVGVDSPLYAAQILSDAQAQLVDFTSEQTKQILQNYQALGMDGSDDKAFGKTPLALQAALTGKEGITVLPLPESVVLNHKTPWDPFVVVTPVMNKIVLMPLDEHFRVISRQPLLKTSNQIQDIQKALLQNTHVHS